jgi:hypothetical protein
LAYAQTWEYIVIVIEEVKTMAESPNSDIDCAMTAFGGVPMPYRSFADVPSASIVSSQATGNTADFPLLVSALPAVAQSHIPHPLSNRPPTHDGSERSATKTPAPMNAGDGDTGMSAPANLETQPGLIPITGTSSTSGIDDRRVDAPAALPFGDPPFRHPSASHGLWPDKASLALDGSGGYRMSLEVVFRTLRAAKPNRKPLIETQKELQKMFSLL